jgi:hypothetical protein
MVKTHEESATTSIAVIAILGALAVIGVFSGNGNGSCNYSTTTGRSHRVLQLSSAQCFKGTMPPSIGEGDNITWKNNNSNRTSNKLLLGNCWNSCTSAASKQYAILAQEIKSAAIAIRRLIKKKLLSIAGIAAVALFLLDLVAWIEVKNNKQWQKRYQKSMSFAANANLPLT